jgi:transposase-like protein
LKRARRKRADISDQQRAQIVAELKKGQQTALELAKAFDVTTSTINQLKQRFGLTRKRGAK